MFNIEFVCRKNIAYETAQPVKHLKLELADIQVLKRRIWLGPAKMMGTQWQKVATIQLCITSSRLYACLLRSLSQRAGHDSEVGVFRTAAIQSHPMHTPLCTMVHVPYKCVFRITA